MLYIQIVQPKTKLILGMKSELFANNQREKHHVCFNVGAASYCIASLYYVPLNYEQNAAHTRCINLFSREYHYFFNKTNTT